MSGDTSERKTETASKQKLRKQREKGVVSQAAEMSNYIAQALVFLSLLVSSLSVLSLMRTSLDTALYAITQPFNTALSKTFEQSVYVYASLAAPTFLLALAAGVLVTMIYQKGLVFAVEPIIPKAESINPASGLKRMFGLRGMVELGLSLARLAIWIGAFSGVVVMNYQSILTAGLCGMPCLVETGLRVLFLLTVVAIILFLLFSLVEAMIQTFLFGEDQKMTKTEVNQERKDQHGSKEVRAARKKFAREIENAAESVGPDKATMVIYHGEQAVAIRYHPDDAPVPSIAAKGTDSDSCRELRDYIRKVGYRETESETVVRGLINRPLGEPVPEELHEALKSAILKMYGNT